MEKLAGFCFESISCPCEIIMQKPKRQTCILKRDDICNKMDSKTIGGALKSIQSQILCVINFRLSINFVRR